MSELLYLPLFQSLLLFPTKIAAIFPFVPLIGKLGLKSLLCIFTVYSRYRKFPIKELLLTARELKEFVIRAIFS